MRIALYGGSFNPPHLSHQLACAVALAASRPQIDEVWAVPTFRHAFGKQLAPYADRHAMCVAAMAVFGGRVLVSRIEEELGGPSYTLRTVQALRARHPEHEFSLVVGADLLAERPRWHEWSELAATTSFTVIGRVGSGADAQAAGARDHHVGIDLPALSSTEVRRRLAAGESTTGLLDEAVLAYIRSAALYGVRP